MLLTRGAKLETEAGRPHRLPLAPDSQPMRRGPPDGEADPLQRQAQVRSCRQSGSVTECAVEGSSAAGGGAWRHARGIFAPARADRNPLDPTNGAKNK
jgi:hypothetical protein